MKNQGACIWPCSATSCDVAFTIPLPLWACLLGSVVGNQVARISQSPCSFPEPPRMLR